MSKQKIIRTGNSLAVTIPHDFAASMGVKPGGSVLVEVRPESGKIIYSFSGARQLPLSQGFLKKEK